MNGVAEPSRGSPGRIGFGWRECLLAVDSVLLTLGAFELWGQLYAARHPAFDVLYLQPDPVVGWKEVPGLVWVWAGGSWYANEFTVPIHTNSVGFRDKEREPEKPPRVQRVAVLGDSYVEALQVPLGRRPPGSSSRGSTPRRKGSQASAGSRC